MKHHDIIGMTLPIITALGDGWNLVAHPNTPAIANEQCLVVLELAAGEPSTPDRGDLFISEPDEDEIPHSVRKKAIAEYVNFTWDACKAGMTFPGFEVAADTQPGK